MPNWLAYLRSGAIGVKREVELERQAPGYLKHHGVAERWYPPYNEHEYIDIFGVTDFGRGVELDDKEITERLDGRGAAADTKRVLGGTI